MQVLLELAPVAAFFVAYYAGGLYTATAVLMLAMALLLVADYARLRRIPGMHALSAALVFVFGTATIALHDQRFIQWKPTIFFWLLSAAFLGSFWIGERPLIERILGKALEGTLRVPAALWRALNWQWVVFYAALGAANLLVAFKLSQRAWVNFKVVDFIVTVAFMALQLMWISRRAAADERESAAA